MASLRRSLTARTPGGVTPVGGGRAWRVAALAVALVLPAGFGCTGPGLKKTKSEFAQALHLEKPSPATQMICFWQRRPQHLPDPSRDGVMAPGLVGQLFLISADNKPVEITGDLVVQALDETPRPKGQPAAVPEVWQIDKVALRKLATNDDRFGTCYAIFLPWPASWKDVTNVRMQAKYISKPNPDLFASDVQMTLEFAAQGAPVWNDVGGMSPAPKATGPSDMRGIPDLAKAFKRPAAGGATPPALVAAHPAAAPPAAFLPPPPPGQPGQYTSPGPDGSLVTTKVWTGPAPTAPPPMGLVPLVPTVTPPVQLANFGPAQPIPVSQVQPLTFDPIPPLPALTPPTIPAADGGRPWGAQPSSNGGLPPVHVPAAGPLQPIVIPRD